MMRRFENKTILVTGGSSGIGRATAERFAREGGRVLIFADRAEELRQTAEAFQAQGWEVSTCHGDIALAADVDRAVAQAMQTYGKIDVLVSNAGFAYFEPFVDISEVHWDRLMAVNLKGMFLVSQCVAREMIKVESGVILFTSSVNGLNAETGLTSYNASKAGLATFMEALRNRLSKKGVTVVTIKPGPTLTPMTAHLGLQKAMTAEEVARVILRKSRRPGEHYVKLTHHIAFAIIRHIPGWIFRKLPL